MRFVARVLVRPKAEVEEAATMKARIDALESALAKLQEKPK